MNIGEKIKKMRTSKFMTQADLAGDQITRNMLSLIESGSAMPSLPTVIYIAERLNVPVGFLLAEGDDEIAYRKMSSMPDIKKALLAEDYRICKDICLSISSGRETEDDEINLILAECNFGIAKEYFFEGRLKVARRYFDAAIECAEKTIYSTDHIVAPIGIYFEYMRDISMSLDSENDFDNTNQGIAECDAFCRYVFALRALEANDTESVRRYIDNFGENTDAYCEHISSLLSSALEDFESAYERLLALLKGSMEIPEVLLYRVFGDLEEYAKMFSDYKGAYEYSGAKLSALEKMLSE